MNETALELLSRYLDGDLPPAEARRLDQRLASEPQLRDELEAMSSLRQAVRDLAARDQPPAKLESLLEPLRRSAPAQPVLRPAFRWLAAAATAVIGVGLAIQVARRNPAPTLPTRAPAPRSSSAAPDRGLSKLQPLPDRGVDKGEELIGAADRLLASPLPEPQLQPAAPLEVIGPLAAPSPERPAEPAPVEEKAAPIRDEVDSAAVKEAESHAEPLASAGPEGGWAPAPQAEVGPQQQPPGVSAYHDGGREAAGLAVEQRERAHETATSPMFRAGLRVLGDDGFYRMVDVTFGGRLAPGRYELLLTVADGRVMACRTDTVGKAEVDAEPCAQVMGAALSGLADGEHAAELVVP